MNRRMLVKKTLRNRRGYKYHTYETAFTEEDGSDVFSLRHYGTLILKVTLSEGALVYSRVTSVSDRDMVNIALGQIGTKNRMHATKDHGVKEIVSENRFLRHVSGRIRTSSRISLFDRSERVDRDGSALAVENLYTGKVEAFETSTRRRKFWLKRGVGDGEKPELYGREAREPVNDAEYMGSIAENEGLVPLVVGHTLKRARSTAAPF